MDPPSFLFLSEACQLIQHDNDPEMCQQLLVAAAAAAAIDNDDDDDEPHPEPWQVEDDDDGDAGPPGVLCLRSLPLPTYSPAELAFLSEAVANMTATTQRRRRQLRRRVLRGVSFLQFDRVVGGIDWDAILGNPGPRRRRQQHGTRGTTPLSPSARRYDEEEEEDGRRYGQFSGRMCHTTCPQSSASSCSLLGLSVVILRRWRPDVRTTTRREGCRRHTQPEGNDEGANDDDDADDIDEGDYHYAGLDELAEALRTNTSLRQIEIECLDGGDTDNDIHQNNVNDDNPRQQDLWGVDASPDEGRSMGTGTFTSLQRLFEGTRSMEQVVFRGILPDASASILSKTEPSEQCSWRYLVVGSCDLTEASTSGRRGSTPPRFSLADLMPFCIPTLEELCISDCRLSPRTIQALADAYTAHSAQPRQDGNRMSEGSSSRRKKKRSIRKNPLQVLDLSNNTWVLPTAPEEEADPSSVASSSSLSPFRSSSSSSLISCMASLAGLLDALSNLVELDLSNTPDVPGGVADLCGTVNHSLRRLKMRACDLRPPHLCLLVQTFCFLEGLDVSENPMLLLLPPLTMQDGGAGTTGTASSQSAWALSQLEHLQELVMINMGTTRSSNHRSQEDDLDDAMATILRALSPQQQEGVGVGPYHRGYSTRRGATTTTALRSLNLNGNVLGHKTTVALGALSSVSVLSLSGCQIRNEGLMDLLGTGADATKASRHRISWREVDLTANNIGDGGALALARAMGDRRLPHLQVVNMAGNTISTHALRGLVELGVARHCQRLESLVLSNDGAATERQREGWNVLQAKMDHYLLLNRAGRIALCEEEEDDDDHGDGCGRIRRHVPPYLWPYLLEEADAVYGADALYHFLHQRPDIAFASRKEGGHPPLAATKQPFAATTPKTATRSDSPKSVVDLTGLFRTDEYD
jgi:hypothetical protein